MSPFVDHPLRHALTNELHARPFPAVSAQSQAVYLAMMPAEGELGRDRAAERAHLIDLLDRFEAPHPHPDSTHFSCPIGQYTLKWESHTEFVTYTIFEERIDDTPFTVDTFSAFPDDWMALAPGARVTSAVIRVETADEDADISEKVTKWFVPESLAISRVLDDALVVATDFRVGDIDHMRFAIFARPEVGARRIGRVLQRLCEIETYKAMAMLGLMQSHEIRKELNGIDAQLSSLLSDMVGTAAEPAEVLAHLLSVSTEVEHIGAQTAFRFAATKAYEKIVAQRIEVLREERFQGRQTFSEFMMRRFDPAMRTVNATDQRLRVMSERALRAGELLRTKVDVERSAQNQSLLSSMDERAARQLRLQKTVEGLSTVAISYYAVNLSLYLLGPFGKLYDISKIQLAAGITPFVLIVVWMVLRRIHQSME